MDFKLELIPVPVSDVDRAKAFYERAGFAVDNDVTVKGPALHPAHPARLRLLGVDRRGHHRDGAGLA
jgi:hypothetical protein